MSENDQGEVFLLGQIEQLACAGNATRSVVVRWTNWPISSEMSLDGDGINGKKHRAGLRQMDKHRLVSRDMSTGLDEFETRKQLCVAINQLVSRGRLIPLRGCVAKTLRRIKGQSSPIILLSLDDQPKQFSNERCLMWNVSFVHPLHLPFPDHVHRLISL